MYRAIVALLATLTLSACGGGGGGDGSGTGVVSGRVVDDQHRPLEGVTVVIQDVTTITDLDGRFSIPDVTRPYTVMVTSYGSAFVFVGLTRSDPTLEALLGSVGPNSMATLDGVVNGGTGFPQPANHRTLVYLSSDTSFSGGVGTTLNGADDDYGLSMHWSGAPMASARLDALQFAFNPATQIPTAYTGYGETLLTVSDGAYPNLLTQLAPVATNSFSGAISLPAGFTGAAQLRMRRGRRRGATLFTVAAPAAFDYPIPGAAALSAELLVNANGPTGTTRAYLRSPSAGSTNHVATLPIPAGFTAPQSGTTNVDHTVAFSAAPFPNRVYAFTFRPNNSGMNNGFGPSYTVFTTTPTTTIPDLSAWGIVLTSDQPYLAEVRTISPFDSIDEAAGTGGLSFAHAGIHYETLRGGFNFQTAP